MCSFRENGKHQQKKIDDLGRTLHVCCEWYHVAMSLQVSILSALLYCGRALPTYQTTNEEYLAAQTYE